MAEICRAILPNRRLLALCIAILLLLAIAFFGNTGPDTPAPTETTITAFLEDARNGKVQSVELSGSQVTVTHKNGAIARFNGWVPEDIVTELIDRGVDFSTAKPSPLAGLGRNFLLLLLIIPGFIIAWHFIGGANRLSLGGKPHVVDPATSGLKFNDIAGQPQAKQELIEIIDFLKDPAEFTRLGARPPKGALMVGPPGVGKTLLARAVAGEANAAFISCSGSDFRESYMGVGASKIRSLFNRARKHGKCCIFIDEIEVLGRRRSAGGHGGGTRNEEEATLNALLVEMDGFVQPSSQGPVDRIRRFIGLKPQSKNAPAIVVLAATNRPDMIDEALLRPGRFDRHVHFDYPDTNGRLATLQVHARGKKLSPDVDLARIARQTTGMSGADIAKLLNEAAIRATRRQADHIEMIDLEAAYVDTRLGRAREGASMTDEDRLMVAVHEAGHALASALVPHARKPDRATIIPRGLSLGAVLAESSEDARLISRQRLMADLVVLLSGRAAELVHAGPSAVTTGAEDDFRKATAIARKMAGSWSMLTESPVLSLTEESSQAARTATEHSAQAILNEAWSMAVSLLKDNAAGHKAIVDELLEAETIDGARIAELLSVGTTAPEE